MDQIIKLLQDIYKYISENWITIFSIVSILMVFALFFLVYEIIHDVKKASNIINAAAAAENAEYVDRLFVKLDQEKEKLPLKTKNENFLSPFD